MVCVLGSRRSLVLQFCPLLPKRSKPHGRGGHPHAPTIVRCPKRYFPQRDESESTRVSRLQLGGYSCPHTPFSWLLSAQSGFQQAASLISAAPTFIAHLSHLTLDEERFTNTSYVLRLTTHFFLPLIPPQTSLSPQTTSQSLSPCFSRTTSSAIVLRDLPAEARYAGRRRVGFIDERDPQDRLAFVFVDGGFSWFLFVFHSVLCLFLLSLLLAIVNC